MMRKGTTNKCVVRIPCLILDTLFFVCLFLFFELPRKLIVLLTIKLLSNIYGGGNNYLILYKEMNSLYFYGKFILMETINKKNYIKVLN